MKSNPDYRSQAAKKILESEGGVEEEPSQEGTLMDDLNDMEFQVAEHGEPEELDSYLRGKTRYEEGE